MLGAPREMLREPELGQLFDLVAYADGSVALLNELGLCIVPDMTFDDAPPFDVRCVPGGSGVNAAMENAPLMDFLRKQEATARYVSSACLADRCCSARRGRGARHSARDRVPPRASIRQWVGADGVGGPTRASAERECARVVGAPRDCHESGCASGWQD